MTTEEERPQKLIEGQAGEGCRYRTASVPGYVDFFSPAEQDEEPQQVFVGGPIEDVKAVRDGEVLVITDRAESTVRRNNNGKWVIESSRLRHFDSDEPA